MTTTITTLSVLVQNSPGVLARIAGLFARRGFNIESLSVGPTEREDQSRMTIVALTPDEATLEQITKQLNKLVEVIKIIEMEKGKAVRRELILVKIHAEADTRAQVLGLVDTFRGKVVDVAADSLIVEVTGKYGKVHAFLDMIAPYGIKELVQSGSVALARGSKTITDKSKFDRTPRDKS
ncbi:MAG: acetolactate synthase small subunit [Propionibacteriaceae bacterium]|jgi:acetolactate synthase-1/3 small subunit|nr:acetolactate synthase small subunit [Propionibacteriaceae bacterium]